MSTLAAILDRFSGFGALKDRIVQQDRVIEGMQKVVLDPQRDIAELRGMMKAIVALQGHANKAIEGKK